MYEWQAKSSGLLPTCVSKTKIYRTLKVTNNDHSIVSSEENSPIKHLYTCSFWTHLLIVDMMRPSFNSNILFVWVPVVYLASMVQLIAFLKDVFSRS